MEPKPEPFVIALPIYEGVDLLDVAAPYEMFGWMRENWKKRPIEVCLVAERLELVHTRDCFPIMPHRTFAEVEEVNLLWTPGGDPKALLAQMDNDLYMDFLRTRSAGAEYVTSVCEGALLLAEAGLLDGYRATTHWAFKKCLEAYPEIRVADGYPSWVWDDNRMTGGGISSGLDEALELIRLISDDETAKKVQLVTQYFPCPPAGEIPGSDDCPLDRERRRQASGSV